jgi:hypothetical protein
VLFAQRVERGPVDAVTRIGEGDLLDAQRFWTCSNSAAVMARISLAEGSSSSCVSWMPSAADADAELMA